MGAGTVVAIVLGFAVVGGGAYYFATRNKTPVAPSTQPKTNTNNTGAALFGALGNVGSAAVAGYFNQGGGYGGYYGEQFV